MPVENKKNYENEEIHTDNLDHWYGSGIIHSGLVRMIIVSICIVCVIYAIFKIMGMM